MAKAPQKTVKDMEAKKTGILEKLFSYFRSPAPKETVLIAGDNKAKKVAKPDGLHAMHLSAAQRIAFMFEKAKFAEYVDMMQKPMRFAWLNFWGGIWRGVGMALGGTIVTVIVIFFAVKGLSYAFQHAGGIPWIGDQVKEMVGWLLEIIQAQKGQLAK